MTIDQDYSLVCYDPHQGILGRRSTGPMRPVPRRTSAPAHRYNDTAALFPGGSASRQGQPPLTYSLRRTIESAAVATGQVVDIFV